ncbi:MAG: hypothetical protein ACFB0A_16600 [Croceivirga sp.]
MKNSPFYLKKSAKLIFNETVEQFYNEIPLLEQHEIVVGFSRLVALFKYGHTRMSFSDSPVPFHAIPIELYRFKDGLRIKSVHKKYRNVLGAEVLAVEGVNIKKVVNAVYPTVPVENSQFFDAYGLDHIPIPEVLHAQGIIPELKSTLTLTLKKDGKQFDRVFESTENLWAPTHYGEIRPETDWVNERDTLNTPLYLKHFDKTYYFEYLAHKKTVYVRHSRIRDDENESTKDFYHRVFDFIDTNDVEKLVLDVRLNGGGNSFLNKPIITGIIANKKINQPGRFFVITGRRTFSAAQRLINELDNYTNVLFVGEPSSENINFYGDNKRVILPHSKLPVDLSFVWWQDKAQWQNADFIKPHYPIEMAYEHYVSNQDPALETVLSFNPQNFTMEPLAYLSDLFYGKRMDYAQNEIKRMVQEPAFSFFDFERELSNKGFVLLGNDNDLALFFLELTTIGFPHSENAWINLAQAQLELKDYAAAKSSCERVLNLSKNGAYAIKARNILDNVNKKQ